MICDSFSVGGCFMSSALPSALRARFQEYIVEGLSGRAAAARLKLSAATGVRWQHKLRTTGSIAPPPLRDARLAMVSYLRIKRYWKSWLRRMVISRCQNSLGHWKRPLALPCTRLPSGDSCASSGTHIKKVAGCHRAAARA